MLQIQPTIKKNRRPSVSGQDFVAVWRIADSRKEVADKLGMSYSSVIQREKNYRKAGVHLKEIPHAKRGRKINVQELNELC